MTNEPTKMLKAETWRRNSGSDSQPVCRDDLDIRLIS
jgi:hypothetical protein